MLMADGAAATEAGIDVCWPNSKDPEVELGCWPNRVVPADELAAGIPNMEGAELVTDVEVRPPNNAGPAELLGAVTDG